MTLGQAKQRQARHWLPPALAGLPVSVLGLVEFPAQPVQLRPLVSSQAQRGVQGPRQAFAGKTSRNRRLRLW
ncbi:MAG: hypothetical protein ACRDXB_08470 [Actinomycetes bacterium]